MKVTVTLADPEDRLTFESDLRDVTAFDLTGRKQLGVPFQITGEAYRQAAPTVYAQWLSWNAARRQNLYPGDFDSWVARVTALAVEDDGSLGLDPTSPAAPPG